MNSIKQENDKPITKMICDQLDKKIYMMHYRMLKFYIRHKMKITKIHTIYQFKQSPWLKKYIDFITEKKIS